MIQTSLYRVVRGRYLMPVVMGLGLGAMVVNEATYQHSFSTLNRGIALTDARVQSAHALQLLTDAELLARAFVLSGLAQEHDEYQATVARLHKARQGVFDLVASVDTDRTISVSKVQQLIDEALRTSDGWVQLAASGQRQAAMAEASGRAGAALRSRLRKAFDEVLTKAMLIQQGARVSLYDALMLNRLAVHLLALLAAAGLFMYQRQFKSHDLARSSEQTRLAELVQARTSDLTDLAGHLVSAREDERARLARDLHDEMGGLLTAMKLEFARLRRMTDLPAAAAPRIASIEQRLNEGIALKRRIVENLRPSSLEQLGLVAALQMLCADTAQALGVPVQTELAPVALGKDVELTVYRLVQEALTNASKYARCQHISVSLRQQGEQVQVHVADDGQGFHAQRGRPGQHGILGMRFRAESHGGTLHIDSRPGAGTRITAMLPVNRGAPAPSMADPGAVATAAAPQASPGR